MTSTVTTDKTNKYRWLTRCLLTSSHVSSHWILTQLHEMALLSTCRWGAQTPGRQECWSCVLPPLERQAKSWESRSHSKLKVWKILLAQTCWSHILTVSVKSFGARSIKRCILINHALVLLGHYTMYFLKCIKLNKKAFYQHKQKELLYASPTEVTISHLIDTDKSIDKNKNLPNFSRIPRKLGFYDK